MEKDNQKEIVTTIKLAHEARKKLKRGEDLTAFELDMYRQGYAVLDATDVLLREIASLEQTIIRLIYENATLKDRCEYEHGHIDRPKSPDDFIVS